MTDELSREAIEGRIAELYQAGMSAYEHEALREALPPWSQCLAGLRSLGGNQDMIAILLYYCGTMFATFELTNQALAFFESAAYILKAQPPTVENADTLLIAGQSLVAIGHPQHAVPVFKASAAMFETHDAAELHASAMQELAAAQESSDETGDITPRTYRFAIRHGKTPVISFTVDATGDIAWADRAAEPDPLAADDPAWNVQCLGLADGTDGKSKRSGANPLQKLAKKLLPKKKSAA